MELTELKNKIIHLFSGSKEDLGKVQKITLRDGQDPGGLTPAQISKVKERLYG
tara:strand:+ start:202 stop:360 length:159 start_codon:yes stop_codon:yes gene_type:complete